MKKVLTISVFALMLAALLAFTHHSADSASKQQSPTGRLAIVRCSPDWNLLQDWLEDMDIPPIPGAGVYRWKISTGNDSAQFYFDQGINMYYSFHIIEAMASFQKAARFDPDCAMLAWAEALGYGPNINDLGYRASPQALAAVKRSIDLSVSATPFEKALIEAMAVRYTADSADATRALLNQEYTDKMQQVYRRFPNQADAKALYADAMMLQHPWDLWQTNGTPKQWTPTIRKVLEELLAKTPLHPGGNHYYIHVMEPSPYASLALPSAGRLGKTNPGLSHVVHMPSHIFLRTGYYDKGVKVNEAAVKSYQLSIPMYGAVTAADFLYLIHNLHMQTNNAMLGGRAETAIQSALQTAASVSKEYLEMPAPLGSLLQYIHATPLMAYVQFGKWSSILEMKPPAEGLVYSDLLYRFARGMAYAGSADPVAATAELEQLRLLEKDSTLAIPFTPFSAALEGARVADALLHGAIAESKGNLNEAVDSYKKADSIESKMVYNEPRDWLLSPKHYLGRVLLSLKRWKEAEAVFRADLAYNNENGWSLCGLLKSLEGQRKKAEAAAVNIRYKKAFPVVDAPATPAY